MSRSCLGSPLHVVTEKQISKSIQSNYLILQYWHDEGCPEPEVEYDSFWFLHQSVHFSTLTLFSGCIVQRIKHNWHMLSLYSVSRCWYLEACLKVYCIYHIIGFLSRHLEDSFPQRKQSLKACKSKHSSNVATANLDI